jgi:hypothetical protein
MKTTETNHPLGTYPAQFQTHLTSLFYRPETLTEYDRCLNTLGRKMPNSASAGKISTKGPP